MIYTHSVGSAPAAKVEHGEVEYMGGFTHKVKVHGCMPQCNMYVALVGMHLVVQWVYNMLFLSCNGGMEASLRLI